MKKDHVRDHVRYRRCGGWCSGRPSAAQRPASEPAVGFVAGGGAAAVAWAGACQPATALPPLSSTPLVLASWRHGACPAAGARLCARRGDPAAALLESDSAKPPTSSHMHHPLPVVASALPAIQSFLLLLPFQAACNIFRTAGTQSSRAGQRWGQQRHHWLGQSACGLQEGGFCHNYMSGCHAKTQHMYTDQTKHSLCKTSGALINKRAPRHRCPAGTLPLRCSPCSNITDKSRCGRSELSLLGGVCQLIHLH